MGRGVAVRVRVRVRVLVYAWGTNIKQRKVTITTLHALAFIAQQD